MGWLTRGEHFDLDLATASCHTTEEICKERSHGEVASSKGQEHRRAEVLNSYILHSRASQWATHFEITDVNKHLKAGEAYTYDLEWSPDAVKPPIKQNVRAVPPAYIE